jgi:signal transduction histidine kinase
MPDKPPSLRRRALHVVIVLLVFYPVGLYVYTQQANRTAAETLMLRNIDTGLSYCQRIKAVLEEAGRRPDGPLPGYYGPLLRLRQYAEEDPFDRRLHALLYRGGMTDTLIHYTRVLVGDECLLDWGHGSPERIVGEVVVDGPIDYEAVRQQILDVVASSRAAGICRVILPLELSGARRGRLEVGLRSTSIGTQIGVLSQRLSMRALRMSLLGTSLLALLAAYIVYLNDRTSELELKLEEEKRLAYVGTIAAGMAHEIRNPLSSVKMNIQMIEARLSDFGQKESDYLVAKVGRIHRETARLEESVNNFLAFARPKPLQRRWADLNEAVEHVIEFLEPACQNDGIRIVRDFESKLPQVFIDAEQLGQAVENLIRNAHQAIGDNGTIEVYTGRQGDAVEVRVSDDGPGISAADAGKIFDIFYTTKEGGSGLGLTIVKQIAEAHGGGVTLDTIVGKGTTFTVGLPLGITD